MLTLVIIIALGIGFYLGYRRGVVLQTVRFIGLAITFVLATQFFEPIAEVLELLIPFPAVQPDTELALYNEQTSFLIDEAFYRVITFILIGIIGWLITNFLSVLLKPVMYYEISHYVNSILGGIINALITYVIIFLILFTLSLIPIEFIQQLFVDNPFAYWIVSQTPFLADFANNAWLTVTPFS